MPNLLLGNFAKEAAKVRFRSFNITLPAITPAATTTVRTSGLAGQQTQFQTSNLGLGGGASRLSNAGMKASGSSAGSSSPPPPTGTPMQFPPALFRAASNSKDDVDNQKGMHDMFTELFDGIIDAIEFGFNLYRQTAGLVDVQVMGVQAIGGRLQGPALDGLIARAPSVAAWGGWKAMVRDAVAKGMEQQWSALARSVTVSGLPWYPAFAAFPGPQAPPMPNVPMPFVTLVHDVMATSPQNLKVAMRGALRGDMDYCMEFFDSVATAFQTPLQLWKVQQQVSQVLGTGPVPTFAPPYVPVGPVVGGRILPGPHIST